MLRFTKFLKTTKRQQPVVAIPGKTMYSRPPPDTDNNKFPGGPELAALLLLVATITYYNNKIYKDGK